MGERVFTREDAKSLIRTNTDKVRIPSDFTAIGVGALAGFSQVKDLTIPEGVTRISSFAFFTRSFRNTSKLERLTIPSTLKQFDPWCFYDCNELKTINLPADFPENIALELFFHCPSATLNFGKKLLFAARSKTIQQVMDETSGILTLGAGSMLTIEKDNTLRIPSSYVAILPHAMRNLASRGIRRIVIPNSVKIISANAFSFLDTLEEVVFENGSVRIDNGALAGCKRLKKILIPETVTQIGVGAFMNCLSLETISLPNDLNEIPDELFSGDKQLKSVRFGNRIARIGAGAFSGCESLQSMMLPDTVKSVGNSAFWACSGLQRLYIPPACESLSQSSLGSCPSLNTLYMPRIIHDEHENKRVFGDITNPTVTWIDDISQKPYWDENEVLPQVDLAAEIVQPVPAVPQQPVLPSDVPIQSAFANAAAPIAENVQAAPVFSQNPAPTAPIAPAAPAEETVNPETVRRLEQTIAEMKAQMAEMTAKQNASVSAAAPQQVDQEAIAALNRNLSEIQSTFTNAQSIQKSAEEIESLRKQIDAFASVQAQMDEIAARQASVQEKVDALSDVQEKVDALSDVEQKISVIPELQQKVEEMSGMQEKVDALSGVQEKVEALSDMQEKVEALSDMQEKVEAISELQEKVSVIPEIQQTVAAMSEQQTGAGFAGEAAAPVPAVSLNPVKQAYNHATQMHDIPENYGELDQSIAFVPVHEGEYGGSEKVYTHDVSKSLAGPVERSNALKQYTVIASRSFLVSEGGERFEIPEGIRRIESQAFWDCPRLMALELPKSLQEVEPDAFSGCSRITDVYLCEGFPDRKAVEYFLFRPEIKLHWPKKGFLSRARVATVAELMEQYDDILTPQKAKKLTVRNHILEVPEGYTILAPNFAQDLDIRTEEPEHTLRTISLPSSLRRIAAKAFTGLEMLVHIVLPEGLQIIDMNAFTGCLGPHRLVLPDSVSYIGPYAFAAPCQYEQIRLPRMLRTIPENLFSNCNTLVSLRIPDSVEKIGDMALSGCTSLTNLTIPKRFTAKLPAILDGPVKINVMLSEDCSTRYEETAPDALMSVVMPSFQPAPESRLFTQQICNQCANFNERIKEMHSHPVIASLALSEVANQTKFEIPLGVLRLCSYAFGNNTRLMTLTIPKALTEFEHAAFYNCQKLRDVFLPEEFDREAAAVLFMYQPSILVSFGSSRSVRVRQLMLECPWILAAGDAADIPLSNGTFRVPDGYVVIGSYMYHGIMRRRELRRIEITETVRLLGSNSISNIRNLEEIVCENGLHALLPSAITNCPSLKRIVLPPTLEFLGVNPFTDCPELEEIVLPRRFEARAQEIVRACPKVKLHWCEDQAQMPAAVPGIPAVQPEDTAAESAAAETAAAPVPEIPAVEPAEVQAVVSDVSAETIEEPEAFEESAPETVEIFEEAAVDSAAEPVSEEPAEANGDTVSADETTARELPDAVVLDELSAADTDAVDQTAADKNAASEMNALAEALFAEHEEKPAPAAESEAEPDADSEPAPELSAFDQLASALQAFQPAADEAEESLPEVDEIEELTDEAAEEEAEESLPELDEIEELTDESAEEEAEESLPELDEIEELTDESTEEEAEESLSELDAIEELPEEDAEEEAEESLPELDEIEELTEDAAEEEAEESLPELDEIEELTEEAAEEEAENSLPELDEIEELTEDAADEEAEESLPELDAIEELTEETADEEAEESLPELDEIEEMTEDAAEEEAEESLPELDEISDLTEREIPNFESAINRPEIEADGADVSLSMLSDFEAPVQESKPASDTQNSAESLPELSEFTAPEPEEAEEPFDGEPDEPAVETAEEPAEEAAETEEPETETDTESEEQTEEKPAEPEPEEILEIPDLVPMDDVQIPGMHIDTGEDSEELLDIPELAPIEAPAEINVEKIEIPEDGKFTVKECRKQYHGEASYTIPFGYREIRAGACAALDDLETLVISDTVTKVGNGAFSDCASLKSVYIPLSVVEIGEDAFDGCDALETVTIPHRFEEQTEDMFPEQVQIKWLEDAEPQTIVSGNGRYTAKIRTQEYDGSSLLTIPEGYREIRSGACAGLEDLTEVVLPESLTKICAGAFADCTGLERLAIPVGVTAIEEGAFEGCTGLKLVALPPHLAEAGKREFPDAELFFLD